jgi:hypothetical protein
MNVMEELHGGPDAGHLDVGTQPPGTFGGFFI